MSHFSNKIPTKQECLNSTADPPDHQTITDLSVY